MNQELSHFEQLSAKTPTKQPVAILIGMALLPLLLWAINLIAPNEGVKELKQEKTQDLQAEVAPASADDVEEL